MSSDRQKIAQTLSRILQAGGEVRYYWKCYHQQYPDEHLELTYANKLNADDLRAIKLSLSLGFLSPTYVDDEHAEDDAPDGCTCYVRLTQSGFNLAADYGAPWWRKAFNNIATNIWAVVFSVFTSLVLPLAVNRITKTMGWN